MSSPAVSIILATYNRAHIIGNAIASALVQTYTDFELLIIDDGSQDNTAQVTRQFNDARIRYFYQENAGLAAARNSGIELAQGNYITFLDDDDLYLPNCLTAHLQVMRKQPQIGWTSGGYRMVNLHGDSLGEHRPWESHDLNLKTWLFWCPTAPSAVMVKREWLQRAGGFDPAVRLPDDWDMWLRLAGIGCPMRWIPDIVFTYRIHANNMVRSSQTLRSSGGILRVLDKFYTNPDLPPHILALRNQAYAHAFLKRAAASFRSGECDVAVEDALSALQTNPDLLNGGGLPLLEFLLGHASSPLVDKPLAYAATILDNLPDPPIEIAGRRRQLMGKVAASWFFSAAVRNNHTAVRQAFAAMACYDPSWLKNRGVWSLLGTAVVGPKWATRIRQTMSKPEKS